MISNSGGTLHNPESKITLLELVKKFEPIYKEKVAYTTSHAVNGGLLLFSHQFGDDSIVKNITTAMLNEYFDKRLYNPDKPLTNGGIQNIKGYVSLLFNYAQRYGYIKDNPMDHVKISW